MGVVASSWLRVLNLGYGCLVCIQEAARGGVGGVFGYSFTDGALADVAAGMAMEITIACSVA